MLQVNKTLANFHLESRGNLFAIDYSVLKFQPVRSFVVSKVPQNIIRGEHAHFVCQQHLFVVFGVITMYFSDGKEKQEEVLKTGDSVLMPNLTWGSQRFITRDAILLVLCDQPYDKNDYITDYNEFLKIVNTK